jgi:hypothetical protein
MTGVIVSRLALFGALVFLVKFVEKEWASDIAYETAWLILIFPTAYFYSLPWILVLLLKKEIGALLGFLVFLYR